MFGNVKDFDWYPSILKTVLEPFYNKTPERQIYTNKFLMDIDIHTIYLIDNYGYFDMEFKRPQKFSPVHITFINLMKTHPGIKSFGYIDPISCDYIITGLSCLLQNFKDIKLRDEYNSLCVSATHIQSDVFYVYSSW